MFISAAGDEDEAQQSLEGLKAAGGYIRHELVSRLGIAPGAGDHFRAGSSRSNTAAGSRSCCSEFRKRKR